MFTSSVTVDLSLSAVESVDLIAMSRPLSARWPPGLGKTCCWSFRVCWLLVSGQAKMGRPRSWLPDYWDVWGGPYYREDIQGHTVVIGGGM